MNTATISSKYQITIPQPIREQFGLKPGQRIAFIPYNRTLRIVIVPPMEQARGLFIGIDADPQREKADRAIK